MDRLPQINVITGEGITYATVNKALVAWYWLADGRWYVAGPQLAPEDKPDQRDAVQRFMQIATGARL